MADKINFKINNEEWKRKLKQIKLKNKLLAKRLRNTSEPLDKARFLIYRDVIDHFRKEQGPRRKWKALRPSTIFGRRRASRKPLQNTGRMRMSISSRRDGQEVKVGTNLPIARVHDEGATIFIPELRPIRATALRFYTDRGNVVFAKRVRGHSVVIPKREFMYVSKPVRERIFKEFRLYVRKD